jgi:hypothetical protein
MDTITKPKDVKLELTGGSLWEHWAISPNGNRILRRGSCFDCVDSQGYLTFDSQYAQESAAELFRLEAVKGE